METWVLKDGHAPGTDGDMEATERGDGLSFMHSTTGLDGTRTSGYWPPFQVTSSPNQSKLMRAQTGAWDNRKCTGHKTSGQEPCLEHPATASKVL